LPQLIRTSNPALNDRVFRDASVGAFGDRMTIDGTVNKTGLLLICTVLTAAWTWHLFMQSHDPADVALPAVVGAIGGLVFAMVTVFKNTWAPVTAPIYALLEGMVLGGVSAMFEVRFPGIAIEAVSLTFGTLVVMLLLYRARIIPVTQKFRLGVVAATGGIFVVYLITWVLGFFGVHFGQSIYGATPIGIGFSVFVVVIAALNLVLDFDFIEHGAAMGAPRYMEWYGAFGLMVTLIWLYFEILRLLSKLRSRR
jgi:uncharacterized YccA/Bax inhibitor family protein